MKFDGATSFRGSLRIQQRVIWALLMREIITRYGRHNIGFMWMFVEPMLFTLGIAALWSFSGLHGDGRFHAKCNTELFEKRKDRAMIIVSHQHEQIVAHCDKAAVLHKGELACFDNVADAYEYYQAAA